MTIGIVSIFDNDNLGNRLQNYALQEYLKQYGDNVITFVNLYRPRGLADNIMRRLGNNYFLNKLLGRRKGKLIAFSKNRIRLSRKRYYFERKYTTVKPSCDWYCAGSDQVWNPNFDRCGMFNYLGFAERERTFSYAASFGVDAIAEKYRDDVRRGLQHIRHISVREESGRRIVEELTGRTDVQVLVDPTMLLTRKDWDKAASKPRKALPARYILTYFLGEVSREREAAVQEKAKALSCQVIGLMDPKSPFYAIGPDEFVYLIKHAALVCTDSFHASVFSFLYQRPLAIFAREGSGSDMGSRLQTLAAKFHLESSLVKGNQIPELPETPDYRAGYAALEAEREKAKAFLDMVFRDAERNGL